MHGKRDAKLLFVSFIAANNIWRLLLLLVIPFFSSRIPDRSLSRSLLVFLCARLAHFLAELFAQQEAMFEACFSSSSATILRHSQVNSAKGSGCAAFSCLDCVAERRDRSRVLATAIQSMDE